MLALARGKGLLRRRVHGTVERNARRSENDRLGVRTNRVHDRAASAFSSLTPQHHQIVRCLPTPGFSRHGVRRVRVTLQP